VSPEDASAAILRTLAATAQQHIGGAALRKAVLAVPVEFSAEQVRAGVMFLKVGISKQSHPPTKPAPTARGNSGGGASGRLERSPHCHRAHCSGYGVGCVAYFKAVL
jgi:hypothetical protein